MMDVQRVEVPVASPCNSVCLINRQSGFCEGCFRTVEEIANWMAYSNPERLEVLDRCDVRQLPTDI